MNRIPCITLSLILLTASLAGSSAIPDWIKEIIPSAVQVGRPFEIHITTTSQAEWITLFAKENQSVDFAGYPAEIISPGHYRFLLPPPIIKGGRIHYYIAARLEGSVRYYPDQAPQTFLNLAVAESDETGSLPKNLQTSLPNDTPKSSQSTTNVSLKVDLNGSGDYQIAQQSDSEETQFHHQQQLGVQMAYSYNKLQVNLRTRLGYSDQIYNNNNKVDLADLSAALQYDHHRLELGDLNFVESEFSISAMGRRGTWYQYQGRGLQLRAFAINSQQMQGFLRGFGFPSTDLGLFGGALGYKGRDDIWSLTALIISGKDDPSKGINNGYASFYKAREGSLFSFFGTGSLFNRQLRLSAEAAFSKADRDLSDTLAAENGLAWKTEAKAQSGNWRLNSFFRKIDRKFESIGQPFFSGDRQSYGADSALRLGSTDVGVSYQRDQSGSDGQSFDPSQSYLQSILSKNQQLQVYVNLMASSRFSLRLSGSQSWQEAKKDNLILPEGDLKRTGITINLSWVTSPSASISLNGGFDQISSETASNRQGKSFNLQLGGMLSGTSWITLTPGLNYNRQENPQTGDITNQLGAFMSGRLKFIKEILSLDFTGSYNNIDTPQGKSTTAMVDGGLMLESGNLIHFGCLGLSLRGSYSSFDSSGITSTNYRLYLRGDYSLY